MPELKFPMTEKEPTLTQWLEFIVKNRASDFHMGDGVCPAMRLDGELIYISDKPFSFEYTTKLLKEHLPEERFRMFEKEKEMDYSFGIPGIGRFRVNLYFQRSSIGAAIRALPFTPMSFEDIGFPTQVAESLVNKPSGLILVTGPTGSGKTTTLAAMIDYINANNSCHIVTIEDPIEFLFRNKMAKVSQREVGSDTHSFNQSLKHVLRQDPDVILVGEMRDLETIEIALTVAETGHLVFATLHTPDAVQSINRIIDVFPAHQQQQVRVQVSFVLQAVISQQLLAKTGGGLCMAPEILIATPAVRNLIRESKSHQLYSSIQMGQKDGMKTLNMSLVELVKAGKISKEDAMIRSMDILEFDRLMNTKAK
jgi:twitching motility protein PilT